MKPMGSRWRLHRSPASSDCPRVCSPPRSSHDRWPHSSRTLARDPVPRRLTSCRRRHRGWHHDVPDRQPWPSRLRAGPLVKGDFIDAEVVFIVGKETNQGLTDSAGAHHMYDPHLGFLRSRVSCPERHGTAFQETTQDDKLAISKTGSASICTIAGPLWSRPARMASSNSSTPVHGSPAHH